MSLFEADLQALDARGERLRRFCTFVCVCAFGLLLLALGIVPGGFGRTSFRDVQLHFALWSYFNDLGVRSTERSDQVILGVNIAQLQACLSMGKLLVGILGVSCLLRLKWRPGLGILVGLLVFNAVSGLLTGGDAYRAADAREFGVGPHSPAVSSGEHGQDASTPEPAITPLAADASRPTFHRVGASETSEPALPAVVPSGLANDCDARERQAGCEAMAQAIRAVFVSDMARLDKHQRAAMHYTAAEIAYLDGDRAQELAQLDAIQPSDFDYTTDSDWRIRVMQRDLDKHGLRLRPGAYRPVTGVSFASLRTAAAVLASVGLGLLLIAAAGTEAKRIISLRVKRLRQMLATPAIAIRRFGQSAAA